MISTDGPTVTRSIENRAASGTRTYDQGTFCSVVQYKDVGGVGAVSTDTLDGFRITGGKGTPRQLVDGTQYVAGGGIFIVGSSPTITNNQIVDNFLGAGTPAKLFYGAGIYVQATDTSDLAEPVITTNLIDGNEADPGEGVGPYDNAYALGGGIYLGYNSKAIVNFNAISNNSVGYPGTPFQRSSGGGIAVYSIHGEAVISQNLIASNLATVRGGGITLGEVLDEAGVVATASQALVENNVFEYNSSGDGARS